MVPVPGHADEPEKTVRVGWFDSQFNSTDQFGRRSGIGYEYQQKIAAYTGWNYEYVEGSWPDLMDKLQAGEIDLLSDVSHTPSREGAMLFSALSMGAEEYYLYVDASKREILQNEYSTLEGKRVGVNKGSVQAGFFNDWAKSYNIHVTLLEMTDSEEEALQKLLDGEIDAYVSLDSFGSPETVSPMFKVGSSDYYFAVNKNRPDLVVELDAAMAAIHNENPYYNQQLYEKYVKSSWANLYLSADERAWLSNHGTIKVGYQNNYLAFCAEDQKTGELIGALADYLQEASDSMEDENLVFEAIGYPTAEAAMTALKNGEVDCMFPANLTDYDGEMQGVVMTPPLMRSNMYAVVRSADQQSFVRKENVTVAVNEGNPNYDMFLIDHFPTWQTAYFKDTPACLQAIADGNADCILISIYRFGNISKLCDELDLTTVFMGIDMDYSFAVRKGDSELYSILAKANGLVSDSSANAALTYYSTEDAKVSFGDILKEHLATVIAVIAVVGLIIALLLLRSIRAEKIALEEKHRIDDLNKRVFVDPLTSVRNKGAFSEYIDELQEKLDSGEELEFAIGVFDCDNLKMVNDRNGHDKGDEYLKSASKLICKIFQHSPVFRIGGDEFAVALHNEDFQNRVDLVEQFEIEREKACASAENEWNEVHVALGIAVYDPSSDRQVIDVVRRADKVMYENKRIGKLLDQQS